MSANDPKRTLPGSHLREASQINLGRKAASLGDQSVILRIGLRSVGLERRIRHFPISLFARPDRIDFSFLAPLRDIDTIDASAIEAEHLLLKQRRKLRVPMRFDQHRCDLKTSE